jgi:small GTP-binding protein
MNKPNSCAKKKKRWQRFRLALSEIDVPRESLATLQEAILQLDELFLVVIVGEFNAGKSALINALLGERVLPEGRHAYHLTRHSGEMGRAGRRAGGGRKLCHLYLPLPLLKELNIVDTPGTNAVIRQHERLTNEYVPRSDLVLFATSADHPMTESERQFLERILAWGKKVVFVLNKADIIEDEAALREVQTS